MAAPPTAGARPVTDHDHPLAPAALEAWSFVRQMLDDMTAIIIKAIP